MALVGGGGAGNVAGSNPAGVGTGLNYIGEHAYAYSGNVTTSGTGSANTITLKFSTGSSYFVGSLSAQNNTTDDSVAYLAMTMDGSAVIDMKLRVSALNDVTADLPIPIIIPPFTEVEVLVGINSGSNIWTTQLTGRVYY